MQRSDKNWVVFLLSASGAEEPTYPTLLHWLHGAKKGDSSYDDPNITVCDTNTYDMMYHYVADVLKNHYGYDSDQQQYHTSSSKMYIGRHVQKEGMKTNAFTLRMAFQLTVWDDRRISIARDIAEVMHLHFCDAPIEEQKEWKEKGMGYDL